MSAELALRPAAAADLPALAEIHLAARRAADEAFPPGVHADDEVRAWVGGWDLTAYDVWVATPATRSPAIPAARRRGSTTCTSGPTTRVAAWVERCSTGHHPASAWVLPLGLRVQRAGPRLLPEPGLPGARAALTGRATRNARPTSASPGRDPTRSPSCATSSTTSTWSSATCSRGVRRSPGRCQSVKPSGERDAVREAEIARRVAAVAPELGEERVARIVDVIITESLAASTDADR